LVAFTLTLATPFPSAGAADTWTVSVASNVNASPVATSRTSYVATGVSNGMLSFIVPLEAPFV
jgi:hypothetical protein